MTLNMAGCSDLLECVICSESLADPRPLPCGHSYCGPPRLCLKSMENSEGWLRCAVCRVDHNLKAEDIKPLYGIRDYIHESSNLNLQPKVFIPCEKHQNKECVMWCNNCDISICDVCIEGEHDGHSMRKLKKYLVENLEAKFGKSLKEGIQECEAALTETIAAKTAELEKLKSQKAAVQQYSKYLSGEICFESTNEETVLLWNLSEAEVYRNLEKSEFQTQVAWASTQTKVCRSSDGLESSEKRGLPGSGRPNTEVLTTYSSASNNDFAVSADFMGRSRAVSNLSYQTTVGNDCNNCGLCKRECTLRFSLIVMKFNPLKFLECEEQSFCDLRFSMSAVIGGIVKFIIKCRYAENRGPVLKFVYVLTLDSVRGPGCEARVTGFWCTDELLVWRFDRPQAIQANQRRWINENGELTFSLRLEQKC